MTGSDQVGVDLYSPPVVGGNYADYWENTGSGWELKTNSVADYMSFGSVMNASTTQVPEPTMIGFSVLGGLGLLTALQRLRRKV
jgi:hypothetical protein